MIHSNPSDLTPGHAAQFEKHARVADEAACWQWTGSHDRHGYATARAQASRVGAHRLAYILLRGEIPEGLVLDHLCRNRWCVNPWHLEPVTNHENTLRQRLSGVCRNGHVFTAETECWSARGRSCRICMRACNQRANAKRRAQNA